MLGVTDPNASRALIVSAVCRSGHTRGSEDADADGITKSYCTCSSDLPTLVIFLHCFLATKILSE